jgi:hypothetical protein
MKLFSSTQMSWHEPYFFVVRLREPWGWARRGILALFIAGLMFAAVYFIRNPQMGTAKAIAVSLAAGLVLVALMDVGNIQRQITIRDDGIVYHSEVGTMWTGFFAFKDIRNVRLMRPEDWNKSVAAMLITTADDAFVLGVPHKVTLATVANVLHRLGVEVALAGWEPSESDTRVQVKDEIQLPAGATRRAGKARIWPVDENEARLTPTLATVVAFIIALSPLALSLLGLIGAGIYLFLKWGTLDVASRWLIGGGTFAALVVSFVYLVVAGQFLAARYTVAVGKSVLRSRPGATLTGSDEELIPVEIFDRTAWTSMMARSIDFGFLQIDGRLGSLRFEGDKNRWDIPVSALTACRIEEAHVGSEGNENAEKRYYVVIASERDGEAWEAGMIHTRTAVGNDGKDQRYARAQGLLSRISSVVAG